LAWLASPLRGNSCQEENQALDQADHGAEHRSDHFDEAEFLGHDGHEQRFKAFHGQVFDLVLNELPEIQGIFQFAELLFQAGPARCDPVPCPAGP
jgi:hypothetical protein